MTLTNSELEKEVREIAEYLGCNADELWSEIAQLINKQIIEARIDELNRYIDTEVSFGVHQHKDMYNGIAISYNVYRKKRLTQLRTTK